jgi:hypothetical protein
MGKQKLYFFAPLGNVDESILKLKLKHGFEFDSMSNDEGRNFIGAFEKIPPNEIFRWRHFQTTFLQKKLYYIKNSFDYEMPENADEQPSYFMNFYTNINRLVDENVVGPLRFLRLFKPGNIHMTGWYVYRLSNNIPNISYAGGGSLFNQDELFHLEDTEIESAQNFFDVTRIPKDFKYLELALENFELSYTVNNPSLAFLSLMIASEVLFNPGKEEVTQRISRNFAVLLGNSVDGSKKIQKEIKALYGKRSALIHNGEAIWNFVGEDDEVAKLRNYVRASIKKIIQMNLSKDALLDLLNSKGFGQLNV